MNLAPDYIDFWLKVGLVSVIALVVLVIAGIAIPLYGIWYEKHRDNDYMDRVTSAPIRDEPADLIEKIADEF